MPLKTWGSVIRPRVARSGAVTLKRPGVVFGNFGLCASVDGATAIDATRIIEAANAARRRRSDVSLISILLIG
jgi:hypothetical protein